MKPFEVICPHCSKMFVLGTDGMVQCPFCKKSPQTYPHGTSGNINSKAYGETCTSCGGFIVAPNRPYGYYAGAVCHCSISEATQQLWPDKQFPNLEEMLTGRLDSLHAALDSLIYKINTIMNYLSQDK